jgi:hypothetical protein
MTASQTTVRTDLSVGIPAGMQADDTFQKDNTSARQAETSATIPFGVFVAQGTGDQDAKLVAATSDKLKGLSVWGPVYAPGFEIDATTGNVLPKTMFDVARHGRFYVYPESAVTPASGVHVRATGSGQAGALLPAADSTNTIDVSKFCRWITSGDATHAAVLEINMTDSAQQSADS